MPTNMQAVWGEGTKKARAKARAQLGRLIGKRVSDTTYKRHRSLMLLLFNWTQGFWSLPSAPIGSCGEPET